MKKTIILGKEHDDRLRSTLVELVKDMGGRTLNKSWGVGGTQEVEIWEVEMNGSEITFEAETYIGLSISGEQEIVDEFASRLTERLRNHDRSSSSNDIP